MRALLFSVIPPRGPTRDLFGLVFVLCPWSRSTLRCSTLPRQCRRTWSRISLLPQIFSDTKSLLTLSSRLLGDNQPCRTFTKTSIHPRALPVEIRALIPTCPTITAPLTRPEAQPALAWLASQSVESIRFLVQLPLVQSSASQLPFVLLLS